MEKPTLVRLAALPTARPDVVLMDLRFHGETRGIEATARIKTLLPHTQVILFTEFPEDTNLGEAVKAGASGFLLKKEVQDSTMIVDAIHTVH
jgi:DNA-binding NarL/FixJ family response regulator